MVIQVYIYKKTLHIYHQQPFTFRLRGFSTQDDTGMTSHSFHVSRDHFQQTQACTIYIHLKLNNKICLSLMNKFSMTIMKKPGSEL